MLIIALGIFLPSDLEQSREKEFDLFKLVLR